MASKNQWLQLRFDGAKELCPISRSCTVGSCCQVVYYFRIVFLFLSRRKIISSILNITSDRYKLTLARVATKLIQTKMVVQTLIVVFSKLILERKSLIRKVNCYLSLCMHYR